MSWEEHRVHEIKGAFRIHVPGLDSSRAEIYLDGSKLRSVVSVKTDLRVDEIPTIDVRMYSEPFNINFDRALIRLRFLRWNDKNFASDLCVLYCALGFGYLLGVIFS